MTFASNFVLVDTSLIEPRLRLRVNAVKPYSDTHSEVTLEIWHDPLLSPERLTMPYPEEDRKRWQRYSSTPLPEVVPFESDSAEMLASIELDTEVCKTDLVTTVIPSEHLFRRTVSSIRNSGISAISEHPYELIGDVLLACQDLPFWDREAANYIRPRIETIALCIGADLADELAAHGIMFSRVDGDALVWRREPRS